MDLNKLKQNDIKEMEIEGCKIESDKIVRELYDIKEKFEKAEEMAILKQKNKIEEYLTKELGFIKDTKTNFVDYRLESEEVGKIRIEIANNNSITIQDIDYDFWTNTEKELCGFDWEIKKDFWVGYIKHKYHLVDGKEKWNKELRKLREIQKIFEDVNEELIKHKGDIFTFVVQHKDEQEELEVTSLVDFIKEKLEKL